MVLADLEGHGLQVPQLHDVLCGGHVLVDDPELYEEWRFDKVSHPRLSSHHHDIDKKRYPDFGMRGQVVREKLHGRTRHGTWVQMEKTPAAFGKRKLPSPERPPASHGLRRVPDHPAATSGPGACPG